MNDTAYREALKRCAERYLTLANDIPGPLQEFVVEFRDRIDGGETDPYPLLKLNRWLGYIQGVLIEKGVTTVEAERDWTRPLFRPLDFAEPTFCDWAWEDEDTERLRAAHQKRFGEDCRTETLYSVAAEGIRIWCERGMPGLRR